MSTGLVEKARCGLEEIDALERLAVATLSSKVNGAKRTMERDAIVKNVARDIAATSNGLCRVYDDPDGALRLELSGMRGMGVFTNFYGALKETREYYARFATNAAFGAAASSPDAVAERAKTVDTVFSGEEVWGKYLDLGAQHSLLCNLPGSPETSVEYVAYLRTLATRPFAQSLAALKHSAKYVAYVESLDSYLVDFWTRSQPLIDIQPLLREPMADFERAFRAAETSRVSSECDAIDLSSFNSSEELEALGLDRLKSGLMALGLKCGGDVAARAARLFSVKGVDPIKIDPKLKVKSGQKRARDEIATSACEPTRKLRVAAAEKRVELMLAHLEAVLEATARRAERKQTRTKDEIDNEIRDEEFGIEELDEPGVEEADEDGDAPIYNPKNLPLGWDGRPIPYWLYKLHGLDVAFTCEICGNHTYYGRRAFEQHFKEWRHSHGMRCLRIPNTKHFHGVVKMVDAVALWEQLQEKKDVEHFKAERDEEYEDSDGNVLNRATYEDLARQGLL